jgi:nucleoid DNA-binding protein
MAWTPPTKHLRKKELLGNERFYRLLSEHSNYMDPEVAANVYLSMVYTIVDELRKHKFIRLPTLGDFALVRQKSRPALVGRSQCVIDGMEVLRFYPKHSFRGYFNERQKIQILSHLPPPPIDSN